MAFRASDSRFEDCDESTGESIDPRIQQELEKLNTFTDEINRLETELDEARARYKETFSAIGPKLQVIAKKVGLKTLEKARPYYTAVREAKHAQIETQKAVRTFERSNSLYKAARETISLAEGKLFSDGKGELDDAWQEMLNHATIRVNESENERRSSEAEHMRRASHHELCQIKIQRLAKDNKRAVKKAGQYFDMREKLDDDLKAQKEDIERRQKIITYTKKKYAEALKNLEYISEEVHRRRQSKDTLHLPLLREPGVGAESASELSSLPELIEDKLGDFDSECDIESLESSLHDDLQAIKEDLVYCQAMCDKRNSGAGKSRSNTDSTTDGSVDLNEVILSSRRLSIDYSSLTESGQHSDITADIYEECLESQIKSMSLPRSEASGASANEMSQGLSGEDNTHDVSLDTDISSMTDGVVIDFKHRPDDHDHVLDVPNADPIDLMDNKHQEVADTVF